MNGCRIDFANNKIVITNDFEKKMLDTSNSEYKYITEIRRDFPNFKIIKRTHRTPRTYTTQAGETYHCNQFKNLTYEKMEKFIMALPDNDEYYTQFIFLKDFVGDVQTNKYTLVRKWFVKQFPLFRQNPLFYIKPENLPAVVPFSEVQDEQNKKVA